MGLKRIVRYGRLRLRHPAQRQDHPPAPREASIPYSLHGILSALMPGRSTTSGIRQAVGGKGREYGPFCYFIVKFFQPLLRKYRPEHARLAFHPRERRAACNSSLDTDGPRKPVHSRHKGLWHKFKGYAYAQVATHEIRKEPEGKCKQGLVERVAGFSTLAGICLSRLSNSLDEVERIWSEGDIDLNSAIASSSKSRSRRGEWESEQDILDYPPSARRRNSRALSRTSRNCHTLRTRKRSNRASA